MPNSLPYPGAPAGTESRSVLSIPAFRKLWNSMAFSSFGDWLGLLATTAMALELSNGDYSKANFAIAGVFIVRLLPAVILGPIAGVFADRFDRRRLMIFCDIFRFALYLSIPLVGNYFWLYTATILVECFTLFWSPAKEATVPNMVPKNKLESANQVSLLAAYGTAPIAAIVFSLLALVSVATTSFLPAEYSSTADLALYINAFSFLYTAWIVYQLREIPKGPAGSAAANENIGKALFEGFKFVSGSKIIRGLIFGMLGAFFAAGAVIGLARTFVGDLNAGDAAYGILFGAVFTGLALGIWLGPKVFAQFSRRRIFGATLTISSSFLILLSLMTNLVLAIFITVLLGAFAGISWVTGFTMLGLEVADEVRGRTFAFVQSLIRVSLVLVLAIAPLVAAAIGRHTTGTTHSGIFISFEGGEGSGKSTQTQLLKEYLESIGKEVLLTREPGGTPLGKRLREILLDPQTGSISPRAEALLYAADRANHVYSLIQPALASGQVVITDRYLDSSVAYQGAGRILQPSEVARISRWATENLAPTLTIVMDIPAELGLSRLRSLDRLEAEPLAFHERIRQEFLNIAGSDPERYFVVDATQDKASIHEQIIERVLSLPQLKESSTEKKRFRKQ